MSIVLLDCVSDLSVILTFDLRLPVMSCLSKVSCKESACTCSFSVFSFSCAPSAGGLWNSAVCIIWFNASELKGLLDLAGLNDSRSANTSPRSSTIVMLKSWSFLVTLTLSAPVSLFLSSGLSWSFNKFSLALNVLLPSNLSRWSAVLKTVLPFVYFSKSSICADMNSKPWWDK